MTSHGGTMVIGRLTKVQLSVLDQYKDTNDGRYLQGFPGATELWRPMGLLDWRGEQYGTKFYCITDAGRAALSRSGTGGRDGS